LMQNIYDGGGNILLLARLAFLYGRKELLEYAEGALRDFEVAPANDMLSAFNGIGSLLYIYYSMYRMSGDKKYYESYRRKLDIIQGIVPDENISIDYCGGLAGMIVLFGRIYKYEKDDVLCKLAAEYMDICIKKANSVSMNGLAHGYSGLIMAAAVCYDIMKDEKYRVFMRRMFDIENSSYDPEMNNWKDLRYPDKKTDQIYWCHGAAGIALARLEAYLATGEQNYLHDIDKCVDKLEISWMNAENHSLCHGLYGILDCLCEIGRKLPEYRKRIEELTEKRYRIIWDNVSEKGLKCGMANTYDMFSFMLGITGMAYSIMRYNDNKCPSVLTLEV